MSELHDIEMGGIDEALDTEALDAPVAFDEQRATLHGDPSGDGAYWSKQTAAGYCVPASIAQIVHEFTGEHVTDEDVELVANEIGIELFPADGEPGMTLRQAEAVLDEYRIPSDLQRGSLGTIADHLDEGRSVIAFVDSGEYWDGEMEDRDAEPNHAPVVTGIDTVSGIVYLNDPGAPNGRALAVPADVFEDAWADGGYGMVVADNALDGAGSDASGGSGLSPTVEGAKAAADSEPPPALHPSGRGPNIVNGDNPNDVSGPGGEWDANGDEPGWQTPEPGQTPPPAPDAGGGEQEPAPAPEPAPEPERAPAPEPEPEPVPEPPPALHPSGRGPNIVNGNNPNDVSGPNGEWDANGDEPGWQTPEPGDAPPRPLHPSGRDPNIANPNNVNDVSGPNGEWDVNGDEPGWQRPEPGQTPPALHPSGRGPNVVNGDNPNDVSGPNGEWDANGDEPGWQRPEPGQAPPAALHPSGRGPNIANPHNVDDVSGPGGEWDANGDEPGWQRPEPGQAPPAALHPSGRGPNIANPNNPDDVSGPNGEWDANGDKPGWQRPEPGQVPPLAARLPDASSACSGPTDNKHSLSAAYICDQIQTNAGGPTVESIRDDLDSGESAFGLLTFAEQVKPGGPWDHKPELAHVLRSAYPTDANTLDTGVPGGDPLFYDIWSNVHYGYVGSAAGIDSWILETAHNAPGTGLHSHADDVNVQTGIALYERYPTRAS